MNRVEAPPSDHDIASIRIRPIVRVPLWVPPPATEGIELNLPERDRNYMETNYRMCGTSMMSLLALPEYRSNPNSICACRYRVWQHESKCMQRSVCDCRSALSSLLVCLLGRGVQ